MHGPRAHHKTLRFTGLVHATGLVAILLYPTEVFADKSLLVKVKRADGSESSIFQKVLVTTANANLVKAPGEKGGQPLDPFTIFFRLKTDSGQLVEAVGKDSYWRVGDEEGNPAGWIKTTSKFKTDEGKVVDGPALKEWNTRLVLDPQNIATREKPLNLLDPGTRQVMIPFRGAVDSGSGRALAFVLGEANENDEYPCEFFIGRERTGDEPPDIQDLCLEIAFVLEMTDFMQWDWSEQQNGSITGLSLIKDIVADIAKRVELTPKAKGRVRFAVVQYQDINGSNIAALEANPDAELKPERPPFSTPNVALDFASTAGEVERGLSGLRPAQIGGDWAEDGLAGVVKALTGLSWKPTSSKHVILIGQGAMQTRPKGAQVSQYDPDERSPLGFNKYQAVDEFYGWSSTGKDITGVVEMAKGSGDDLNALMKRVVLHAVLLGRPSDPLPPDIQPLVDEALRWSTEEVNARINAASDPDKLASLYFGPILGYHARNINRKRAERDYQLLARNGLMAENLGIYDPSEPTVEGVKASGQRLTDAVVAAFTALERALDNQPPQSKGQIAERVVEIAEAFKKQLQDKESVTALGAPLNDKGREVAKLRLLVFRTELQRLESLLDRLYQDFRPLTKRSDRQDATETLNRLKAAVATAAAGQQFDENSQLATVIGDLPLRTPVLATSAKALAAMSSEDFERWLGQLEFAKKRCRELLDAGDRWERHTGGIGSEFSFIEQSQMP